MTCATVGGCSRTPAQSAVSCQASVSPGTWSSMVSTLLLLLLVSSATAASLPPLVFQSPVQCRQTTRTIAPKIAQNIDGERNKIHSKVYSDRPKLFNSGKSFKILFFRSAEVHPPARGRGWAAAGGEGVRGCGILVLGVRGPGGGARARVPADLPARAAVRAGGQPAGPRAGHLQRAGRLPVRRRVLTSRDLGPTSAVITRAVSK